MNARYRQPPFLRAIETGTTWTFDGQDTDRGHKKRPSFSSLLARARCSCSDRTPDVVVNTLILTEKSRCPVLWFGVRRAAPLGRIFGGLHFRRGRSSPEQPRVDRLEHQRGFAGRGRWRHPPRPLQRHRWRRRWCRGGRWPHNNLGSGGSGGGGGCRGGWQ